MLLIAAGAGAVGWLRPWEPSLEPSAALPLPDKPSIAVLPFENLSDDAEEEDFADGPTDDLITDLSKVSGLFIIVRNSVFAEQELQHPAGETGILRALELYQRALSLDGEFADAYADDARAAPSYGPTPTI